MGFSISLVRTGFPFDLVSASSCVSEMAETKDGLTHLERVDDAFPDSHDEKVASNQEELDIDPVYSYKEQRAIIRRVDRRLIVTAGIIYMNSLMDRSNLPNAGIAGMNADLEMVGTRYSVVALVFFITYTIFQPPATILTRKIGPRTFLSAICLAWGVVMVGFSFVTKWWELVPLRLVLGLFEAGYFPGVVYLISTWYSRYDKQFGLSTTATRQADGYHRPEQASGVIPFLTQQL